MLQSFHHEVKEIIYEQREERKKGHWKEDYKNPRDIVYCNNSDWSMRICVCIELSEPEDKSN